MSIQLGDRAGSATGGVEEAGEASRGPATGASGPAHEGKRATRLAALRRVHWLVKEFEPWGVLLAAAALFLSLIAFWIEYGDRVEERTVRAWQLLTTRAAGNSGKIEALQYLNRDDGVWCDESGCLITLRVRTDLVGIDLSGSGQGGGSVFLREVKLTYANLSYANLGDANLFRANLTGAVLFRTNLSGANLTQADLTLADLEGATLRAVNLGYADLSRTRFVEADLTGATLAHADLSNARLIGANLTGTYLLNATLSGADLSDADLTGAILVEADLHRAVLKGANLKYANLSEANMTEVWHLTQEQLDKACGSPGTRLPVGFTLRTCESVPATLHEQDHAADPYTSSPMRVGAD